MFKFRWPRRAPDAAPPAAPAQDAARADARHVLARLEWTALRRLDGQLQGDYRTLFRGAGVELADLREYQPHDDVRHIDWNVTARMQVPYVREHQEERDMTAWFVVDLSGSVGFGSHAVSKRALAVGFVALVARVLTRRGNPVGAIVHCGGARAVETMIPARTGKRHVLHLIDRLERARAPEVGAATDLRPLLAHALSAIPRRSTVFVVSDFISAPGWEAACANLARRHEVVAVRLRDPLEAGLEDVGLAVVQDAETGEQLWIDANDRAFRARFAEHAAAREEALRSGLAQAGVDCLELSTDEPLDDAILDFIQLRKRRAQWASGSASASAHRSMHLAHPPA